jgi:hypothetical protein
MSSTVHPQPTISADEYGKIVSLDILDYGSGITLFRNVVDVDQDLILPHLDERVKPSDCGLRYMKEDDSEWVEDLLGNPVKNGLAKLAEQPFRLGAHGVNMPVQDDTPQGIADFFHDCESMIYRCLMRYIDLYPMILNTLQWRCRGHILKYKPGGQLGQHNDNDTNYRVIDGQRYPPDRPQAVYQVMATIVYLNEDFEGGEMYFPYPDVTYKPATGDILFFPQNYVGTHSVNPVTAGERYVYLGNYGQGGNESVQIKDADQPAIWVEQTYLPWVHQDYEKYWQSTRNLRHGVQTPVVQERPLEAQPEGSLIPHGTLV